MKNVISRLSIRPLLLLSMLVFALVLAGCDSSEPGDDGPGEEELITRIVLTFTGGGEVITATATDPDGDGSDFQIDTIALKVNVTYTGTVQVFDDVNGEDIGAEIDAEAEEHQFFFTPGGAAAAHLTVTATDQDSNGLPVGLAFQAVTADHAGSAGTLRIVLSHFDDAPKDGVNPSDESDVDITYPLTIN